MGFSKNDILFMHSLSTAAPKPAKRTKKRRQIQRVSPISNYVLTKAINLTIKQPFSGQACKL